MRFMTACAFLMATSHAQRLNAPSKSNDVSKCWSEKTSPESVCVGCPPIHPESGLPCASTTAYTDLTKGPCGFGAPPNNREIDVNNHPEDKYLWQFTNFTAALNIANHLPSDPSGNCWSAKSNQYACGQCYRLCSTGGMLCPEGGCPSTSPPKGKCATFKITNACVDGSPASGNKGLNDWCGMDYSHLECKNNPEACAKDTGDTTRAHTNHYGYSAHFDLQNVNDQLASLGWVVGSNVLNAEVTWEAISCDDAKDPFLGPNDYQGACQISSEQSFDDLLDASDVNW